MGKRRKGSGRKAYLKHAKRFYDPYSPYAIKMRNGRNIDLVSQVPVTITHGKRGLTIARAEQLPKVQTHIQANVEAAKAWTSLRHQGLTEFHRISLINRKDLTLELFFQGKEFILVQRNLVRLVEARSMTYPSREAAMQAVRTKIFWTEILPIRAAPT